jgi:hypothetical protein
MPFDSPRIAFGTARTTALRVEKARPAATFGVKSSRISNRPGLCLALDLIWQRLAKKTCHLAR